MTALNEYKELNTFYIKNDLRKFCFGFFYIEDEKIFVRKLSRKYSSKLNCEASGIINIFDNNVQIEIASLTRLFKSQNIEVFYDEILSRRLGLESSYFKPTTWIKETYLNAL